VTLVGGRRGETPDSGDVLWKLPSTAAERPAWFRLSSYRDFIIVELDGVGMSTPEHAGTAVPSSVESDQAKLVYLYLDRAGGATADGVAAALSLPKLSVFGVLGALERRGVVEQRDGRYRAT
jgi:hypothetical protein